MNKDASYELLSSMPAIICWNGISSWCGSGVELWWDKEAKKGHGSCKFFISNKNRDDGTLTWIANGYVPPKENHPQLMIRNIDGIGNTISQLRIEKVEITKTFFSEDAKSIYHNIDFAFDHIEEI
jgi:hypothetical protein